MANIVNGNRYALLPARKDGDSALLRVEDELEVRAKDLKDHLAMLEDARLVERDEEGYRLTPRCIAYLDECQGYEWRR